MSEVFISANPDNMMTGKFYRVYTDRDNATLLLPKDNEDALYQDVSKLKTPSLQCWVSSLGDDNNSGSEPMPFKTVQKALEQGFSIIHVLGGSYSQDLNIPVSYGNYGPVIEGYGTIESPKAEIRGTITIPANVSRVRFKMLQIDGKGVGPAIVDNGSEGRHVIQDCTITNPASGQPVINVINGKNWWNVIGSAIEGKIQLGGTPVGDVTFNIMHSANSYLCIPVVNSGYTFTAYSVGKLGCITHNGGNVLCMYVGTWLPSAGKIINSLSTNPLNLISVAYSGFSADGLTYGTISSVGATVLQNYNVDALYSGAYLSVVSTVSSTLITTTASTLIAPIKKIERNFSYNTSNGELIFDRNGFYNVSLSLKIDCAEWNKKIELWFEKWNGSVWEVVPDTGFQQNFQTDQESSPHYDLCSYFNANEKYRLRAVSDSDTSVILRTVNLSNGVKMPAIRLSVSST